MATPGPPKRINFDDALKFITNGDQSDIDDLSSDEEIDSDDLAFEPDNYAEDFEEGMDENISEEENDETPEDNNAPSIPQSPSKQHVFRWRKKDIPVTPGNFTMHQQDILAVKSPVEYFRIFWTDELNELIANETNLYSTQKKGSSVNTSTDEIEQLVGMHLKMGIVQLPSYKLY